MCFRLLFLFTFSHGFHLFVYKNQKYLTFLFCGYNIFHNVYTQYSATRFLVAFSRCFVLNRGVILQLTKHLLAVALVAAFTLSACDSDKSHESETAASAAAASTVANKEYVNEFAVGLPVDAPKVLVATQPRNPPFEFKDERGNIIGFDADVMSAIGADQGFKVTIVDAKWSTIFDGLQAKEYRMVMGSMGETPERRAKFALSNVYAHAPNSIVVPKDSPVKEVADLAGKNVSMVAGSSTSEDLTDRKIKVNEVPVSTTYLALVAINEKKADAAIVDKLVAAYSLKNMGMETRFVPFQSEEEGSVVFAAHKDDAELINKVNAGLANIKKNGIYTKIYRKWFGDVASESNSSSGASTASAAK